MDIHILTLFPQMFSPLYESIVGRAIDKNLINLTVTDIREYSANKHKKCDDYPFGGGDGMVMSVQPIYDAVQAVDKDHEFHRIYLSPQGIPLNQKKVTEIAAHDKILLLCGHYEGVDERAVELLIDEEISIGDYVLTGGELPAMVLVDCVSRYVDGVLHTKSSVEIESFSEPLLEYPQYTRPEDFMGHKVPEVLLSGNHRLIQEWRSAKMVEVTKKKRPDLLK